MSGRGTEILGWVLFVLSALGFILSSLRSGDLAGLLGGLLFLGGLPGLSPASDAPAARLERHAAYSAAAPAGAWPRKGTSFSRAIKPTVATATAAAILKKTAKAAATWGRSAAVSTP